MIDFRYHVVSLAAVLIALAVGIVLGAGPLKNGISEQLNNQVVQLRKDKDGLRAQLDTATKANATHESFELARLPELVAGKLTGTEVVLLTLPQAGSNLVSTTDATLAAAGATITGEVGLTAAYADPGQAAASTRAEAGAQALRDLGVAAPDDGTTPLDAALAHLLTQATATGGGQADPVPPTATARATAWNRLQEADLVSGQLPEIIADAAVVISGPALAVSDDNSALVEGYARTVAAIDAASDGTVLGADLSSRDTQVVSPLASTRSDATLRRGVSTVDDAASTIGQVSIVDALVEQLAEGVGQYGMLTGATRPYPAGG
ncbi:MAG: copper transporter [Tetrasphaera sp.]